jgi:hypothetical protein
VLVSLKWQQTAGTAEQKVPIGTLNVGHAAPAVIDAVRAQLDRFTHTCFSVAPYERNSCICLHDLARHVGSQAGLRSAGKLMREFKT